MDLLSLLSRASAIGRPGARDILPVGSLVLLIAGLLAAGAPFRSPDIHRALAAAQHLSVIGFGLLILSVTAASIFLQPVISAVGGLLQDNSNWSALGSVNGWLASRKEARREKAQQLLSQVAEHYRHFMDQRPGAGPVSYAHPDRDAIERLADDVRKYPSSGRVRSTRLGNVIAASERDAGRPYGFDSRVVLPRLELLLPEFVASEVDARRDDFTFAMRFCATLLLAAIVSFSLLIADGFWLFIPLLILVFAWVSYLNAIAGASAYGEILRVVVDLYRFQLYEALHLPVPDNLHDEHELARRVTDFLLTGVPSLPPYVYIQPGRPRSNP